LDSCLPSDYSGTRSRALLNQCFCHLLFFFFPIGKTKTCFFIHQITRFDVCCSGTRLVSVSFDRLPPRNGCLFGGLFFFLLLFHFLPHCGKNCVKRLAFVYAICKKIGLLLWVFNFSLSSRKS
jgi:hypothetical protein